MKKWPGRKYLNEREKADRKWAEQFPEELLIAALGDAPANRRITLHQLSLEKEDVIIRERDRVYFYFRRKRNGIV